VEHQAWTGISWRVENRTFAHVLEIADGRPPAYARVFETNGPQTVLTFVSSLEERAALVAGGPPFRSPTWRPGIVGAAVDELSDWGHLGELITESHSICLAAGSPRRRAGQLLCRPASSHSWPGQLRSAERRT
jgi:hypothetical protein